ncbi:MAG TPA: NAD(P)/FAD-dependent oxidoreductase [Blastocatellia bacterium]|nr:NAD(P)/FAD-dependent oxidoreductase [Blastocatellia bacterium]
MRLSDCSDNWGIVGGGLLGLTLAHELAKRGRRVTLFESAESAGGLAGAWELETDSGERITWDRHYHVTLLSDLALRRLLAELGLESEMQWVMTRTGVYANGRLYSVSNAAEFLRFPALRLTDKLRLGATIFYASRIRDWKRLEGIAVSDWLRKLSGARTFEKFWLPLLRSKLGDNYRITSASFIWATIARLYAARRTGLKTEMFGYVPGGYARILERFVSELENSGVSLRVNHAATRIISESGSVRIEFSNGRTESFDHVIVTTPATVAARICEGLSPDEIERLNGVRYQGIICASLLLKRPLADFYVTNLTDAGLPFTGVIEMSALVDRRHFGGHALIYLPKYVAADDPAWAQSDDEIRETFLAALERMYSHFQRDEVLAFRVSRVRQVFPIPTLKFSARVPEMVTSVRGLYVVNSAQILNGTLNVNETVQLAVSAAAKLMAEADRLHSAATTTEDAETDSQPVAGSR